MPQINISIKFHQTIEPNVPCELQLGNEIFLIDHGVMIECQKMPQPNQRLPYIVVIVKFNPSVEHTEKDLKTCLWSHLILNIVHTENFLFSL